MHTLRLQVDDDARVVLRRLLGGALFLCLISLAERASQMRAVVIGWRVLIDPIAFWLFWAALTGPALFIVRHIERRASLVDRAMRHAVTAAVLMLVHSAALYLVQRGAHLVDLQMPLWAAALAIARWRLTSNLLVYGAIVGAIRFYNTERVAQDRQRTAAHLAEQLSAAQLEALRLQLNPHFLFNSLNTVAMLVRRGAASDAVHALTRLAELLRRLLRSDGARFVSLQEELSLLFGYLDLEQLRFGDRLRIVQEIDDATLDAHVPPFLLQPIVENAIRHGISRAVAGGTLRISATRVGARLQIEIADDGPGMEPNRIGPPGIGLANTVDRLTALYGGSFDLDIRSMPGATVALISFPAVPLIATLRSAS